MTKLTKSITENIKLSDKINEFENLLKKDVSGESWLFDFMDDLSEMPYEFYVINDSNKYRNKMDSDKLVVFFRNYVLSTNNCELIIELVNTACYENGDYDDALNDDDDDNIFIRIEDAIIKLDRDGKLLLKLAHIVPYNNIAKLEEAMEFVWYSDMKEEDYQKLSDEKLDYRWCSEIADAQRHLKELLKIKPSLAKEIRVVQLKVDKLVDMN